jgi:hypothetical protein
MAYNLKLAERIRSELEGIPFVEKRMFGGVGYLIGGNMACGIHKEDLILPSAKVFDIMGKPMKGWLMVEPDGCKTKKQLSTWVKEGVEFALTLPSK